MGKWIPPKSPYNLIQHEFYQEPWKLLVACIFCNLTKRVQSEPIMRKFFERYPTPSDAANAKHEDVARLIEVLGLRDRRAKALIQMSHDYLEKDWTEPRELFGIGKYANDAWLIFCEGKWEDVEPKDHALNKYHDWLRENFKEKKDEKREPCAAV